MGISTLGGHARYIKRRARFKISTAYSISVKK